MATTETAAAGGWARGIRVDAGLLAAVLSAATFASSGPFAKALLATGWSPGSVVTARVLSCPLPPPLKTHSQDGGSAAWSVEMRASRASDVFMRRMER